MSDAPRHFRFLRPIAAGGFGTVYVCKEEHADGFSRVVAVKLLNEKWTDSEEIASRLRDEARLLGLLRHRNIVDVYDLTSIDGRSAVVMEYLEAIDLRYLIQRCQDRGMRMPVRVAIEIVVQVANALDAAYNRPPMKGENPLRVIHRDIKPSNIMLDVHGLVKVLDFGVAQSDISTRESSTGELHFGSVDYMAPERLFFEPETPASDVYSMASTLYELLTFERLGKAQGRSSKHDAQLANRMGGMRTSIDMEPQVAASIEALLLRALHFEHDQRPDAATFAQDAKEIARRIDSLDLTMWAEAKVPLIVEESQRRALDVEPLSNSILMEDRAAFIEEALAPEPVPDEPSEEGELVRETPRAAALRRGALEELKQSSDIAILPATGAPQDGSQSQMTELTDGDGWNDRTMGDLTDAHIGSAPPPPAYPLNADQQAGLDEVPRLHVQDTAGESTSDTQTSTTEASVTDVPNYDTMDGLKPVRPQTSTLWLAIGALLPLILALLFGGVVVLTDAWGIRSALRTHLVGSPTAPPDAVDERASSSKAAEEIASLGLADPGGIRFVSAWDGTSKLKVHCKEDSATGVAEAVIAREAASRCFVTAYGPDHNRLKKVVDVASSGTWICFEDGKENCRLK